MSVIEVSNLTVHYRSTPVLFDINFSLEKGKLIGILGPNGAGKSTLLKAMLGIIRPVSGVCHFFGKTFAATRKKIAYVPQSEAIDWDFPITVSELVLMGQYPVLGPFKRTRKQDREKVEMVLEKVGMQSFSDRQINQLSGGQKKRAFLARALMQDPELYLLDEPLQGVDHSSEEIIMNILQDAVSSGKTCLMVHHDLHSVEKYFDALLLLHVRLIASGPTKELFKKEVLKQAYGKDFSLFDETVRLSKRYEEGRVL